MISIFKSVAIVALFVGGASASAAKYCRDMGSYACVVDTRTNQCGHSWSNDDGADGMYQCQTYLGLVRNKINKSNYVCSRTTNGHCARNLATNQCTHEWSDREGGNSLFSCQRFLGINKSGGVNKSAYVCKRTTNGYCAMNTRTNQCGHEWNSKDGNAKRQCQNWINN